MLGASDRSRRPRAFTLIELLVVVAIIALLISILIPSLGRARKEAQAVACRSNLQQVMLALRMYQDDHKGWLPQSYNPKNPYQPGSLWSESAWGVSKADLWFYKLTPTYLGNPNAFICPGDPIRALFDYESTPDGGAPRTDLGKAACGYGMNYALRHLSMYTDLMNAENKPPSMPSYTILLAEVGPDDVFEHVPLYAQAAGDVGLSFPWRDGGRVLWNDGAHMGFTAPTWLTARHSGTINMSSFDGAVHKVPTLEQLRTGPLPRNRECEGYNSTTRTFVCYFCYKNQSDFKHYQFHRSKLWWWTGDPSKIR